MKTLTLSIPEELKNRLDGNPSVNWSEFLKERLANKLKQLKKFEVLSNTGEL
jgi:hypothetical protein